jgi:hypothetical protein
MISGGEFRGTYARGNVIYKDFGDRAHVVARIENWAEDTQPIAQLLATAGDLLHSLKSMVSIYPLPDNEVVIAARAAIEKAEGTR